MYSSHARNIEHKSSKVIFKATGKFEMPTLLI